MIQATEIAPFGLGHPRRRPATRERNLSGQPAHPVPSFSTRTQTDVFSFWNLEPSSTVPPIPGGSVVVPCRRWGRGTFAPSQSRSLTCLPPPQGLSPTLAWPARSPEAALRACLLARLPAICLVARCVGGDELPLLPPPPARGTTTQDHRTAPLGGSTNPGPRQGGLYSGLPTHHSGWWYQRGLNAHTHTSCRRPA